MCFRSEPARRYQLAVKRRLIIGLHLSISRPQWTTLSVANPTRDEQNMGESSAKKRVSSSDNAGRGLQLACINTGLSSMSCRPVDYRKRFDVAKYFCPGTISVKL